MRIKFLHESLHGERLLQFEVHVVVTFQRIPRHTATHRSHDANDLQHLALPGVAQLQEYVVRLIPVGFLGIDSALDTGYLRRH